MLMGAYAHAGRKIPAWVLSVGIVSGVARAIAYQLIEERVPSLLAAAIEPPMALLAASIVLSAHPLTARPIGDRVLAFCLALYGVAELLDAGLRFNQFADWTVWLGWFAFGLPLAAVQISLIVTRLGRIISSSQRRAHANGQRLRLFTESTNSTVVEFDQFGTFTYVSHNAEPRLDRPAEAFVGNKATDFFDAMVRSNTTESRGRDREFRKLGVLSEVEGNLLVGASLPDARNAAGSRNHRPEHHQSNAAV